MSYDAFLKTCMRQLVRRFGEPVSVHLASGEVVATMGIEETTAELQGEFGLGVSRQRVVQLPTEDVRGVNSQDRIVLQDGTIRLVDRVLLDDGIITTVAVV